MGFVENGPSFATEEWDRRFVHYFLPYWHLDSPGGPQVHSSVLLLWAAGVALNRAMFSADVLSLPIVSLVPCFALMLCLLGLFRWIDTARVSQRLQLMLYLTMAVPFTAIAITTDYLAFFNSFYQETATFIFGFAFLVALLFHRRYQSKVSVLAALPTLSLLASAKASNAYLSLLALFLIAPRPFPGRRRLVVFASCAILAPALALISFELTSEANDPAITAFHGLSSVCLR